MNAKEIEVIDAINRDGLDSGLWGLCDSEVPASYYDPQFKGELPPHIYVYGDDTETYSLLLDRLLMNGYDEKLYIEPNRYVAFFWLEV